MLASAYVLNRLHVCSLQKQRQHYRFSSISKVRCHLLVNHRVLFHIVALFCPGIYLKYQQIITNMQLHLYITPSWDAKAWRALEGYLEEIETCSLKGICAFVGEHVPSFYVHVYVCMSHDVVRVPVAARRGSRLPLELQAVASCPNTGDRNQTGVL